MTRFILKTSSSKKCFFLLNDGKKRLLREDNKSLTDGKRK